MKKLLLRLFKVCPCYSYPKKFFTIKDGTERRLGGEGSNVIWCENYRCELCGRKACFNGSFNEQS